MTSDEKYMARCLDLARCGLGLTSPNPMVGCVIVHDGQIIGEGHHYKYGGPHAEVNAINAVKDKTVLSSSTLYVSLEPCSHQGKTPPCTGLILSHGFRKVVVAQTDPNPLVNGRGISALRDNGIEVTSGVLEKEAITLNKRFNTFHQKQRPYIILKWARTLDGFIDIDRTGPEIPADNWITNDRLKMLVHKWRTEEDVILVGTNTALNDNPQLNVREWVGRNPVRLVIDEDDQLPKSLKIFDRSQPTIVYSTKSREESENPVYANLDFSNSIIPQIINDLYRRNLQSVIVEGGRELLDSFLASGLWDEARVLTGNKIFGKGLKGPRVQGRLESSEYLDNDRLEIFSNPNTIGITDFM